MPPQGTWLGAASCCVTGSRAGTGSGQRTPACSDSTSSVSWGHGEGDPGGVPWGCRGEPGGAGGTEECPHVLMCVQACGRMARTAQTSTPCAGRTASAWWPWPMTSARCISSSTPAPVPRSDAPPAPSLGVGVGVPGPSALDLRQFWIGEFLGQRALAVLACLCPGHLAWRGGRYQGGGHTPPCRPGSG